MKKRVHISECTDGDVLTEDIMTSYGAVVLPGGTIINSYIVKKLHEFGIEYILVSSGEKNDGIIDMSYHIFEKKYENNIMEMKQLVLELIKGKRIDFTVISNVTNSVIAAWEEPDHIIKCLGKIRNTDDNTYYHCINVSFYAMLIAGWLNLTREDIKTVVLAGLLHDVGKAKISNKLLSKRGKLSIQEFEEIKKHTIYGYELVKDDSQISEDIKDVILMHHEREDKSGYPLRAGSDDLSIYTKIVAVADVYDAMTSNRQYKKALTPFGAFEEILVACRGSLDMHIINTLLCNLSRYYTGSKAILSNGQTGEIVYIPPHCMWKPIIRTDQGFIDLSRENNITITSMA